jgi:prepilin-type N-terminal cleavage/methylation domain-containing protein
MAEEIYKGFTLIELLVVVLIIGILAAIALPQYQYAVEKTRLSKAFILGKALNDSMKRWSLENGDITPSNRPTFQDLDIILPDGFVFSTGPSGPHAVSSDIAALDLRVNADGYSEESVVIQILPYGAPYSTQLFFLPKSNRVLCYAYNAQPTSAKLCKVIGGVFDRRYSSTWDVYTIQ